MISLNNNVTVNNYGRLYPNNLPAKSFSNTVSGSISFSANAKKENESEKQENTKLLTYIIGGIIIAAAAIVAFKKFKKVAKNPPPPPSKPPSNPPKPPAESPANPPNPPKDNSVKNEPSFTSEKAEQSPSKNNVNVDNPAKEEQVGVEDKLQESLNRAYDQKTEEFLVHPELKDKKALIREVMPELYSKNYNEVIKDDSDRHRILLLITPENKDFIFKQAVPTLEKHKEALEIGNSSEFIDMLGVVNADNLDALEVLVANKKQYKIKDRIDVTHLLKGITKDNKEFILEDLMPYLVENSEKYGIKGARQMVPFFNVISPQNKDFMFQKVLPAILDKGKQFNLGISDALKIARNVDQDNFEIISKLAQEPDKYNFRDEYDFLDIDKLCSTLFEKKE